MKKEKIMILRVPLNQDRIKRADKEAKNILSRIINNLHTSAYFIDPKDIERSIRQYKRLLFMVENKYIDMRGTLSTFPNATDVTHLYPNGLVKGQLNEAIKVKYLSLLGREIDEKELAFLFRLRHNLIHPIHAIYDCYSHSWSMHEDNRYFLKEYITKGYIIGGVEYDKNDRIILKEGNKLEVSKPFYDAMNEILWLTHIRN